MTEQTEITEKTETRLSTVRPNFFEGFSVAEH